LSEPAKIRTGPLRQPGPGGPAQHNVPDAIVRAELFFLRPVPVFIHHVDLRLDGPDLRLCVQPPLAGRNKRLFYESEGVAFTLEQAKIRALPTTTYSAPSYDASSKNRTCPEWNQSKQPVTSAVRAAAAPLAPAAFCPAEALATGKPARSFDAMTR